MSCYLWSCKTGESRLAGFAVTLRRPLLPKCGIGPGLLQVVWIIWDLRGRGIMGQEVSNAL